MSSMVYSRKKCASRILIISESQQHYESVKEFLGEEPRWARNTAYALGEIMDAGLEVIFYSLPRYAEPELFDFRAITEFTGGIPIIILGRNDQEQLAINAIGYGADDFIADDELCTRSLERVLRYSVERRRVNVRVEQLQIASQAAMNVKNEFLKNISHKLRTPLTAVLGYSEVMLNTELPRWQQVEYLQTVIQNSHCLSDSIEKLLSVSDLSSGGLKIEISKCSPVRLFAEIEKEVRSNAIEKGLKFSVNYLSAIPELIYSDASAISRILTHLVKNSIRFTDEGSVNIDVSCDSDKRQLIFEVADTGVGLDISSDSESVESFAWGYNSEVVIDNGYGVGLAICASFAEKLGGAITAKNGPGGGSIFRVSIGTGPLDYVDMLQEREPGLNDSDESWEESSDPSFSGTVLVVENCEDTRLLVTLMLEKAGVSVTCAENGQEAIHKARAGQFDLILMDMQMPVLDGRTATQLLRAKGYDKPILAFTADVSSTGSDAEYRALGCDGCLTKPFKWDELLGVLSKYIPSSERGNRIDSIETVGASNFS